VKKMTGKAPNVSVNPDEVVALGAAVQAGVLAGARPCAAACARAMARSSLHAFHVGNQCFCGVAGVLLE